MSEQLTRYSANSAFPKTDGTGSYVLHSEATRIIAAMEAELKAERDGVTDLGEAVAARDKWNTGKAPCSGMYPCLALKFAMANVNANPIARAAVEKTQ